MKFCHLITDNGEVKVKEVEVPKMNKHMATATSSKFYSSVTNQRPHECTVFWRDSVVTDELRSMLLKARDEEEYWADNRILPDADFDRAFHKNVDRGDVVSGLFLLWFENNDPNQSVKNEEQLSAIRSTDDGEVVRLFDGRELPSAVIEEGAHIFSRELDGTKRIRKISVF